MTLEGRRILVVDDDEDIREAVVDTLIDEGYAAVAVGDGQEALAFLHRHPAPGLVLLDWNMTPMNGAQFMAQFAQQPKWASIPVVLVTADARIDPNIKLGAFAACLRKPVNLQDLFGLAARYCAPLPATDGG